MSRPDELMADILRLLMTAAPADHLGTVLLLSELQDTVWQLDAHLLRGGELPTRWKGLTADKA